MKTRFVVISFLINFIKRNKPERNNTMSPIIRAFEDSAIVIPKRMSFLILGEKTKRIKKYNEIINQDKNSKSLILIKASPNILGDRTRKATAISE